MKGYKAFDKGYVCKGFHYEIGKTYEIDGELKMCENGFHFCKNLIDVFGYYTFDRDITVLAEVDAIGDVIQDGTKFCTNKIQLVREVRWSEVEETVSDGRNNSGENNSGHFNSGHFNSGHCNSGHFNSGNYNSGDCNSGENNSGDYNSGDCNSGNHNSGNHNSRRCNSGHFNSGDYNSGHFNSGDYNSGDYNSGNYNSGNHNSGRCNSGNYNSGRYNSGNYNSGFFNSNAPTVRLFNLQSDMTFDDFFKLEIDFYDLENSKSKIKNLPNYDAQIFFEATGIDWREDEQKQSIKPKTIDKEKRGMTEMTNEEMLEVLRVHLSVSHHKKEREVTKKCIELFEQTMRNSVTTVRTDTIASGGARDNRLSQSIR